MYSKKFKLLRKARNQFCTTKANSQKIRAKPSFHFINISHWFGLKS